MPSLLDRQLAFGAALNSGPGLELLNLLIDPLLGELVALLSGPASRNAARFGAYRRNHLGNGRMALASTFPVLRTLLGDRFTELADDYLAAHPSRNADLNRLGDRLAGFVSDHLLSEGRPYLPAMARLEWALQETYDAPQAGTVDFGQLAILPPAQQAAVVLRLWSGAAEIDTDQPVLAIWDAHQAIGLVERDRRLAEIVPLLHASRLMTTRSPSGECGVVALSPGEQALLAACRDRLPLLQALAMAAESDTDFDGGAALTDFFHRGWVAGFDLPAEMGKGMGKGIGKENESSV